MRIGTHLSALLAGLVLAATAAAAHAQAREEGRLLTASQILEELRSTRDQAIPDRLLERAYGIAVIPDVTKIAFFLGGDRGHGALVVRDKQGRFSDPVFVTLTGGSFGWQWGVESTDIVLVFTTAKSVEGINGGKVTLGADASVAAGPVGRQASAATDPFLTAEVYSYSRTRGVFAGLALDGSVLSIDNRADEKFYKKPGVRSGDIFSGAVTTDDPSAQRFLAVVATSTAPKQVAAATPTTTASASTPAAPAAPPPAAASAPAAGSPAQSFPLADPRPGQEPK